MLTSDLGPAWDIAGGAGAVRPRRTSKRAARDGESSPTSSPVPAHVPRKRPSAQRAEPAAGSEAGTGRAVDPAPTRRDKRAPTHRREQPSDSVSSDSECSPRRRRPAQQPRRGDAAAPSVAATSASDAEQSTARQRPEPPHQRKPTAQQAAFAALVEKVHRRIPPPPPLSLYCVSRRRRPLQVRAAQTAKHFEADPNLTASELAKLPHLTVPELVKLPELAGYTQRQLKSARTAIGHSDQDAPTRPVAKNHGLAAKASAHLKIRMACEVTMSILGENMPPGNASSGRAARSVAREAMSPILRSNTCTL